MACPKCIHCKFMLFLRLLADFFFLTNLLRTVIIPSKPEGRKQLDIDSGFRYIYMCSAIATKLLR